VDDAIGHGQPGHAMAETKDDASTLLGLAATSNKGLDDAGSRPPGHVKARHRVAMLGREVASALGPADDGKEAQALFVEPRPLLSRSPGHVRFGPTLWPMIFVAIEACGAHPVLERELVGVVHLEAPLLGRIHEEDSAE